MTTTHGGRGRCGQRSATIANEVLARLSRTFPDADTELDYSTPFELLVATILAAQSSDVRVNGVTPALFARYPDAQALASAQPSELERLIKPTGFFRTKARTLIAMARHLVERHDGEVPASMAALVALPGVGRKTANVVLGHALGVPGLPVDRHVMRVATRLGLTAGRTPERIEQDLMALWAPADWTRASDCLILHGRRVCRPRPLCDRCVLRDLCQFHRRRAHTLPAAGPQGAGRRQPRQDGVEGRRAPTRERRKRSS